MSLAFQSIAPGNSFEFDPDSVLDGDHGSRLEFKCREGRACLVNRQRIVAVHQHVPTPLADSHYEQLDLESGRRIPLTEHLEYPLLGILVLRRRTLRAFEPADHVLHRRPPDCVGPRNDCFLSYSTAARARSQDFEAGDPAHPPWQSLQSTTCQASSMSTGCWYSTPRSERRSSAPVCWESRVWQMPQSREISLPSSLTWLSSWQRKQPGAHRWPALSGNAFQLTFMSGK